MGENRKDVMNKILEIEATMFKNLNTAEPITDDKIPPFKMMRWMSYSVLSDATLTAYLADLEGAIRAGRNLMTEKYALIGGQIPHIKNSPLIKNIVTEEVNWMKELAQKYPLTIKREQANAELFERYALCELETWSDESLTCYYADITQAIAVGKNLVEERYNNMYSRLGRGSLQDIEDKAKQQK